MAPRPPDRRRAYLAGPLEFEWRVLRIPDTGQELIVYCAAPGSPAQAAFRRLGQPAPAEAASTTR